MKLTSKVLSYNLLDESDNRRKAIISFIFETKDGYNESGWQFLKCEFDTVNNKYTEEDWEFVGFISEKIKEFKKELNK